MNTTFLVQASKGNPGAFSAFMNLIEFGMEETAKKIFDMGITGTDAYVLWSDLCDKNAFRVKDLVDICPPDVLKDACGRQDYSGRQLIKSYMS